MLQVVRLLGIENALLSCISSLNRTDDVLFGIGKIALNHAGNHQLRSIVEARKIEYQSADVKDKRKIAIEIIRQIEAMDPPGRFLIEEKGNAGMWVPVDEEKAIGKVSHRLRGKIKDEPKKSIDSNNDTLDTSLTGNRKTLTDQQSRQQYIESIQMQVALSNSTALPPQMSVEEATIGRSNQTTPSTPSTQSRNSSPHSSHPLHYDSLSNILYPYGKSFKDTISHQSNQVTPDTQFARSGNSSPHSNHALNDFSLTTEDNVVKGDSPIPLRGWISRVFKSGNNASIANGSRAVSNNNPKYVRGLPDSYITSALKIAHSLADQICVSQNDTKVNNSSTHSLTLPGNDWAERVVVHLSTTECPSDDATDLEPLALSPENDMLVTQDDIQALLRSIVHDEPSAMENSDLPSSVANQDTALDLCVAKAELLPIPTNYQGSGNSSSENQQIYSLGLVYYELFSGGTRPHLDEFNCDKQVPAAMSPSLNLVDSLNISDRSHNFRNSTNSNFYTDLDGNNGEAPSHAKKGKQTETNALSVETLKLRGLPTSLCSLIGNMIDCANGDLGGDEAYRHMTDVRSDLELMIEKPSKFLYDLDITKLTATGLDLSNTIYNRQQELTSLKNWYHCPWMQNDEFATIVGPSGSGKTVLANQFAEIVAENGGVFLRGKFDQFQQARPFPAIASAFNEYCKILVSSGDPHHAETILKLNQSLKHDASYLVRVIPNLALVFGGSDTIYDVDDCVDAQKRLRYLLHRFVEIISSTAVKPIVMFLDDLQWVDAASASILNQLVLASRFSKFFVLGSYREDEVGNDHPVSNMISHVRNLGVKAKSIKISAMNKETVNAMVSDILCLSPRLTRPLAELVHHKTKGNPLFIIRLFTSLSKEGLLNLSLSRRRWEWDEEKIQERKIPDDVAEFLTGTIGRLPTDVQAALQMLSCFGASADISVIRVLETEMDLQLQSALDVAVSEGFLDKVDDKYRFSHDRLQESAANMMSSARRKLFHSQYGLALCSYAIVNENDDAILFVAVGQINCAGPSVIMDAEQGSLMASLNLKAGSKAMDVSDFASALSFLESGIAFLWASHWRDHYDLSLKLFEKAAKCSYAIGDHTKLEAYSEKILLFASSFADKLDVMYLSLVTLCDASKFSKSIEKNLQVLSQLGEDIPIDISHRETMALVEQTRRVLNEHSGDSFLDYKEMTDQSKITVMKFLRLLANTTSLISQSLYPLVSAKMVYFSLTFGMTPTSAIGFVYFGGVLATLGYIREAYRLAKLAMKLIQRFNVKDSAAEVIALATQINAYVEPLQTTIEPHIQGHVVAMSAGDTRNASFNMVLQGKSLFLLGEKLDRVEAKYDETHQFMKQHNILAYLMITSPQARAISALIGTQHSVSKKDTKSLEVKKKEELLRKHNPFAALTFFYHEMYKAFMFRDYDAMKGFAENYISYNLQPWILLYVTSQRVFIEGLVSFWINRISKESEWYNRGVSFRVQVGKWAEESEWNFLQKMYLLEAEEHFCNGLLMSAKTSYDKAIAYAKKHKFINDEALACELAGHFCLEIGNKDMSVEYFTMAYEKFFEWGAFAKADHLHQFIRSMTQTISQPISPPTAQNGCQFTNEQKVKPSPECRQFCEIDHVFSKKRGLLG